MAKEHEILTNTRRLIAKLPERVNDVLKRRFGLQTGLEETLEAIGRSYGITRERVRQIEAAGLKAVQKLVGGSALNNYLNMLEEHVRSYGGVMEEDHLVTSFQREKLGHGQPHKPLSGAILLLLSSGDKFLARRGNSKFFPHWYLHIDHVKTMESALRVVHEHFSGTGKVAKVEDLVKELEQKGVHLKPTDVQAFAEVSRFLGQNPYGHFGLSHWPEIKPKGVREKAYLVIKHFGKPLHFTKVAEMINEQGFSKRKALVQTVHNELIKDKRFVLVGRGIYALKEWGYEPGTVKDIIMKVLKDKGPLTREQVIQEVLRHRLVKANTIALNLHNHKDFSRAKDGLYTLRSAK